MVLELLLNPKKSIQHPIKLLFVSFVYTIIGAIAAYLLFLNYASIAMIFLTVLAFIPFMYHLMQREEEITTHTFDQQSILTEYHHVTVALVLMFLGITAGFVSVFLFAPEPFQSTLFSTQEETFNAVTGQITREAALSSIILNNLRVVLISVILSFAYGFGALTVIIWNASVLAVAIGSLYNALVQNGILSSILAVFVRYFLHGIPEIAGYLVAGLAGGILSVAIVKHEFGTSRWRSVVGTSTMLFSVSVFLIVMGGFIEVYVTPWFY